ncbi:hypothetical protein ACFH04_14265 [Streptomyces noboritoensis]|uniref:HTH lysR-type domain-containing protein n=1 Tax=Streptomyces noboritoensis TaxID=67337 RepID=A0ABV6TGD9_9ACTN
MRRGVFRRSSSAAAREVALQLDVAELVHRTGLAQHTATARPSPVSRRRRRISGAATSPNEAPNSR